MLRHYPNVNQLMNIKNIFFDYHLLLNYENLHTILQTLKNPKLQLDPDRIPKHPKDKIICGTCHNGRIKAASHYRKEHLYKPGEAFSSDVAVPINFKVERLEKACFVTCLYAASIYAYCVQIHDRTKLMPFTEQCVLMFMDVFNKPPQVFVSDNAQQYVSKDMMSILDAFQIQHHPRTPYHEQENSLAERINQTFMNGVRAALYLAYLPPQYCHYALLDIVDKYNQLWNRSIKTYPYMAFYGTYVPYLEGLQIFILY